MKIAFKTVVVVVLTCVSSYASCAIEDGKALIAATHDLCGREVALLGESSTHGDGHTEAFKVALVQRLVNECGFDQVVFEASHYEFIEIGRRTRVSEAVSEERLRAAIGGLWKFDREFQPLVPFLLAKLQAGSISVAGMDDQLGGLEQDYANAGMIAELTTGLLSNTRQAECQAALHRRVFGEYSQDASYSVADQSALNACVLEMQAAVAADMKSDQTRSQERLQMLASVGRWIARDFGSDDEQFVGRDRSMFENFEWLRARNPKRHKVIVWAATVHIAKERNPAGVNPTGQNFGSYVHERYGSRAFSLGFAALAGSYRQGRREIREVPAASAQSLEASALKGSAANAVYVGPARLRALGTIAGAAFRHSYQTMRWSDALDGVVVFRLERAPSGGSSGPGK